VHERGEGRKTHNRCDPAQQRARRDLADRASVMVRDEALATISRLGDARGLAQAAACDYQATPLIAFAFALPKNLPLKWI
jgi:hypothetical protein